MLQSNRQWLMNTIGLCFLSLGRIAPKPKFDIDMGTKDIAALAGVAQLVGTFSSKPKGHGIDPWSGHMTRSQVWFLVEDACERQLINVSPSHRYFSLSLSPSLPLSLKSIRMPSGEDFFF